MCFCCVGIQVVVTFIIIIKIESKKGSKPMSDRPPKIFPRAISPAPKQQQIERTNWDIIKAMQASSKPTTKPPSSQSFVVVVVVCFCF